MEPVNRGMTEEERTRHEAKMRFRHFELPHLSREERDEKLVELVGENVYVEHLEYENSRFEREMQDAVADYERARGKLDDLRRRVVNVCEALRDWGHKELAEELVNTILSERRLDYGRIKELAEAVCTKEE